MAGIPTLRPTNYLQALSRALAQRLQCRIRTDTFFDHGCIPAALDLTTLDAATAAPSPIGPRGCRGATDNRWATHRCRSRSWCSSCSIIWRARRMTALGAPFAAYIGYDFAGHRGMRMPLFFGFRLRKACSMPFGTSSTTTA